MVSMAKAEGKIQLYQKQTAFIHDYQNQMQCVRTLLMKKNYKEAEQYLEQMCNVGADVWNVIDTNHMIVNAVLNAKYQEAQESGIGVTIKINDLSGWRMAYNDVTILLANLLDNAIEACRSTAGFDKHLSLSLTTSKGFLSILVRNTKDPQTVFNHSTTKKNSVHHGLGLSIIEDICRKYDGSWQWNDCGNTFESVILLRYC